MPFLCPGGSLWRLRKHSRHGGQGPKSRHQPTTSRQVSTRGTLAHPFTQKQVQVDEGLAMSPGSVGGVYLGPAKEQKKVSSTDDVPDVRTGTSGMAPSSTQDKKLAEIRSPTDYYTDGKVSIGHDVSKDVRSPVRQPATTSERTRHDDTLNPDGTLASIVFFEETFLSNRWSQLHASSPKVNLISSRTQDATMEEPQINKISPVKGTLGGNRGLIPSWVRQRRCLPTLDELDFDQIDLISLHSYHASDVGSPGDHRNHLEADESDEAVLTDQLPSNEDRAVSKSQKQSLKKENDSHGKQVTDNRRSALGNLTNKKELQASKSRTSNRSAFHTYKIPNGASPQEQRSQQTSRTSNARKQKLRTCDSRVTASDKQNDHTYVNLNYIAGIIPGNPAKQDHQKVKENDNSIHDYEKVWSTSPDKSSKLQRKMRHSQDSSPRRQALLADSLAKRSKRTVRERRQVDQTHAAPSRVIPPDECVDVSEQRPLLERTPATINQHNGSHPMRNLPIAPARTMKHVAKFATRTEAPSSTSSWESTTASHSTEGDECAAILTGEVTSKRPTHQARPRPNGCEGPIKASYDTHSRDKDVMYIIDHADGYREANFPGDQERRKLIGNPYVQNAARKARIVRTSSVDEKTRGRNSSEESGIMTKRPLKTEAKTWRPKKTPYIGTRRSLPAPPSQKALVGKMTPQQRSTTNVRAVEAKLCQRQNRKIRRTIEGDEVLDALLCQEKNGPEGNNMDNVGDLQKMDGLEANGESAEEVLLQGVHGGSPGREEAWHVERIIQDWKKTSQGQHGVPYPESEVPSVPAAAQDAHPPHLATNRDQDARPNRGNGIQWAEGGRKAKSLERRQDPDRQRAARKQTQTYQVEGSRQGARRIPTAATKPDNAQGRRLTPSSVIEIYIAKEPYKPTERDEIEANQGEILVVNSAMQRENDWMWVYVPRIDSFGYFPAFAACPLEFQPGVRVT